MPIGASAILAASRLWLVSNVDEFGMLSSEVGSEDLGARCGKTTDVISVRLLLVKSVPEPLLGR